MGDHIVHLPVDALQRGQRLRVFLVRWQFLRPPGAAYDPEPPLSLKEKVDSEVGAAGVGWEGRSGSWVTGG